MIRKATCFFWVLILILHANVMSQQWTMTIGNKLSLPNQTIQVPLDVDFSQIPGGVGSIQFEFRYENAVLEFLGFDNVDASVSGINYVITGPGQVFVAWENSINPTTTLNGKLLDLVFDYKGGESDVYFELSIVLITDATNKPYPGTTTSGMVRELKQYTVTLTSTPPALQGNLSGAGTYWEGDAVQIIANVPDGWTFRRWWPLGESALLQQSVFSPVNNFSMPNRDVTIRAEFRQDPDDPVTFILHVVGEGTVAVNGDAYPQGTWELVYERETVLELWAAPDTGWQFDGWSGALTDNQAQQTLTLTEDHTEVTATFKEIPLPPHTLTLIIQGQGSVNVNGELFTEPNNSIRFHAGTQFRFEAIPAEGWRFVEWIMIGLPLVMLERNPLERRLNSSVTITAVFEPIPEFVTLTINSIGSGQVLVDGEVVIDGPSGSAEVPVAYGTTLNLAAWPAGNFEFDGWSGADTSADNEISITLTNDANVTATFIQTFPLTLHVNPADIGATAVGGGLYRAGAEVVISASPVEDYNFDGWTGSAADVALLSNPASLATSMVMPARAVNLTANYTPGHPEEYTLTLLADPGDIGAALSQSPEGPYQQGQRVDISASEVEGYVFSGWTSAGGGDISFIDVPGHASTYLVMPAQDLILVANYIVYIPAKYSLLLQTDPPNLGFIPIGGDMYEEGEIVTISTPSSVGYYFFDYWEQDLPDPDLIDDFTSWNTSVTMPASDLTLTAIYSLSSPLPQYTLTITIIGNGQVTTNGVSYAIPVTVDEGTEILLEALAAEGWEFTSWSGGITGTETGVNIIMDSDKEVTATFTEDEEPPPPPTYLLNLQINGEGAVEIFNRGTFYRDTILEFAASAGLALIALPGNGWSFTGWSGDLSGTDETDYLLMNENKTVIANFVADPITYTLTVHVVGGGEVLVNGTPYTTPLTVNPNTLLVLQPAHGPGWTFSGWSGDHTGTEDVLQVIMNADKEITATFIQDEPPPPVYFSLTMNVNGNGHVLVYGVAYGPGTHTITPLEEHTVVSLMATPAGGWEFIGWSGNLTGENPVMELLMDGNKEVTASFTEKVLPPPPPLYRLSFVVQNQSGILINDAVITLNGIAYDEGVYSFNELSPGSYAYTVSRVGFSESTGTAVIVDADLEVVVIMIADPVKMDFLVLYPNPTRTIITVEANQPFNEMRVYNNLGQLVLSASFNYTLKYTTDVRILANGIYYLRITTERDVRTGKFEVIH